MKLLNELRLLPKTEIGKALTKIPSKIENRIVALKAIVSYLKENGYNVYGRGVFGLALQHPRRPDVVIKLFTYDRPYREFVNFCRTNPENPHLVKFVSKPIKITEDIQIVFMEKLLPFMEASTEVQQTLSTFCIQYWHDLKNMKLEKVFELFHGQYEILNDYKETYSVIETLQHILQISGQPDLNKSNIMIRPKGNTFVFTDPLYDPAMTRIADGNGSS